jgi:hypothetical protein
MDTGKGEFEEVEDAKADYLQKQGVMGFFKVGEELVIKGSHFKVQGIRPKRLILKLLPSARVAEKVESAIAKEAGELTEKQVGTLRGMTKQDEL